ncbi:MAG: ribosome-associated translation inhibitor RaiA [Synergistaceae bacterium]|jgi:putative sigma-54 modulation protein|nr:ribosome-associated translation inhibitor RaiA [Synergistaceae bacterium]
MEVRFVTRGTEIDAGLKEYMEGKVSKLEKFFQKISHAQIVVSFHKGNYNVETTANANGVILRAEDNAQDPRRAFDQALKNLERQIKRHNEYLKDKSQFHSEADFSFSIESGIESIVDLKGNEERSSYDLTVEKIKKIKKIALYPMDPKEAVMQMELVGHSFFMFLNGETGDVNVVYKRKDGNYGQLEPVK